MSGYKTGQTAQLFSEITGEWLGVIDQRNREQIVLTRAQSEAIRAPGALSGVTYDTSNRAIAWTIDGVSYTASYSTFEIVVAGSDGTIRRVALDPAQRITGVIAE